MNKIYIIQHFELASKNLLGLIPQLEVYMPFGPNARTLHNGVIYMNPYVYSVPVDSKLLTFFQLHGIGNYTTSNTSNIQHFS